jgi:hypothetical protein
MKALLVCLAFAVVGTATAQKRMETTFKVQGLCGMCEDRIETALDVKGVVLADWDVESKSLRVVYKPQVLSEEQLHALVAGVGHDTDRLRATDDVYAGLHGCCKYRENASCTDDKKHEH